MSAKSTIDFVNPYEQIAQQHKAGLDYVVQCVGTSSSSSSGNCCDEGPSVQQLISCTVAYLKGVYSIDDQFMEVALRTALTNTVNGYLDGVALLAISELGIQSVPVGSIGGQFDRLEQGSRAASSINGNQASNQLALAIGKANYEYWRGQVRGGVGPKYWSAYMDGNQAIDTASIPYWVEAAMAGSSFGFRQLKAGDSIAAASHTLSALGGSIVVGAGKVMFGWIPNEIHIREAVQAISMQSGCTDCLKDSNRVTMGNNKLPGIGLPIGELQTSTTYTQPSIGRSGTDWRTYHGSRYLCTTLDYGASFGPNCD